MTLKRFWISVLFAALVGILLTETSFAQTHSLATTVVKSPRKIMAIEGTWNIGLKNYRYEDQFNKKNTTDFSLQTYLTYFPVEEVSFHFAPKFNYVNGYSQTLGTDSASQSTWTVREASINAEPFSDILGSAGALDQSVDHPALLLGEIAFPAVRLKLQTNSKNMFYAGIKGESAIPTSASLSTETQDLEKTPSFTSGSIYLTLQKSVVEGSLQAGIYEYQDLPMTVATKSALLGNTTTATSGKDSIFTYGYKGPFAKANLTAHIGKYVSLNGLGEWVQNESAPTEFNQGARSKFSADVLLPRRLILSPFYEYYRIEPDAVVAQYNGYLTTNRVGYDAGLSVTYKKILRITASGGERGVLYETPNQNQERTWTLKLETLDVAI